MKGVRFAPSPTGLFHIGNLRTAWVSHRIAEILNEPWILRIEDIDTARVKNEFRARQLQDLAALDLIPDEIVTQSEHSERHFELFEKARRDGLIYPCDCSRKDVLESLLRLREAPHLAAPDYSGHCRLRPHHEDLTNYKPAETLAWRWRQTDPTGRNDAIVARTSPDGSSFSAGYHWACATDDADGGYRVLVRAWDLASAEKVQSEIRRWMGQRGILVFHTALVTLHSGQRLEKRTRGITFEELVQQGVSTSALLAHFSASFEEALARRTLTADQAGGPETGNMIGLMGESSRQMTLQDLGISFSER